MEIVEPSGVDFTVSGVRGLVLEAARSGNRYPKAPGHIAITTHAAWGTMGSVGGIAQTEVSSYCPGSSAERKPLPQGPRPPSKRNKNPYPTLYTNLRNITLIKCDYPFDGGSKTLSAPGL